MENGNSSLSSSMTDLMTSLAVIFILLLVASLNNAQQEGEDKRNSILQMLLKRLQTDEYKAQGLEIKNDPKDPLGLIIVVPEGLLNFGFDRYDVPPPGKGFLQKIIPKMASTLCSDEFHSDMESVVIEGHTDSSGGDEHNLQLSQNRSLQVALESLRSLEAQLPAETAPGETRKCFQKLLSATGRGSVELIRDQNGNEDSGRSRRVIFKIRVRSLEQRAIKEVIGNESPSGAGN
jgi:outer membrane protein OmpA-like peptidoglycan-associated protein